LWKSECPCCLNCNTPTKEICFIKPKEDAVTIYEPVYYKQRVMVLDDLTGLLVEKNIHLFVITVNRILSELQCERLKCHYGDEIDGLKFQSLFCSRKSKNMLNDENQVWELVRTYDVPSVPLSLKRVGCLDYLFTKNKEELSKQLLKKLRFALGYRKDNSGKSPKNVLKLVQRVSVKKSSIRVNRLGGSNGHASGLSYQCIKSMVISPLISNCLPRNTSESIILWPFCKSSNIIWNYFVPFYVGVKGRHTSNNVKSVYHNAMPQYGFVSKGNKVVKIMSGQKKNNELKEIMRMFTATTYSGARILMHFSMNKTFDCLTDCVKNSIMIEKQERKKFFREEENFTITKLKKGSRVYVKSLETSEKWFAATVENIIDEDLYDVYFDADKTMFEEENKVLYRVPSCLLVNKNDTNILDELLKKRNVTTLFGPVATHKDSGKCQGNEIENKMVLIDGLCTQELLSETDFCCDILPPGKLGYPEYGVCTTCFACSDIELHSLYDTYHVSTRLRNDTFSRGGLYEKKQQVLLL
jgi:hypothetical protein